VPQESRAASTPATLADPETTRRDFLRHSAGAMATMHPVFLALARHRERAAYASALKSEAQYRSEAQQFEAAFRDLATTRTMPSLTAADITRITSVVDRAGAGIDFHDSWMVMICFADPALQAWVRKEIRDEATFNKFVEAVKRDPRATVDAVPGMATLRTKLGQLKAEKTAIATSIIAKEKQMAGLQASSAAAVSKAEEAAKCQEVWAIVQAVVLVVVAVVVALVTGVTGSVFTAASVAAAADALAATYRGTGADLARSAFAAANQRYAQCIASAATLAPAARTKALAACQAAWLADKAVFLS
jgi:hypothetical protein